MADSTKDAQPDKNQWLLKDVFGSSEFKSLHTSPQQDSSDTIKMNSFHPQPVDAGLQNGNVAATLNLNGTRFDIGQEIFCRLAPRLLAMGANTTSIEYSQDVFTSSPTAATLVEKFPLGENSRILENSSPIVAREYFLERHASSFVHILDYFQYGKLHLPPDVCPYVFRRELQHWGVDPTVMSDCCQRRYLSFLDDQETLREFDTSFTSSSHNLYSSRGAGKHPSAWTQLRMRGWAILDDPCSSVWARQAQPNANILVLISVRLSECIFYKYHNFGANKFCRHVNASSGLRVHLNYDRCRKIAPQNSKLKRYGP
ncbi:potassium voltage gated channel protein shaw [Plakobranchus ocellatus]|uniref:Potassium voltage gated channel protein shaw n=1 Tax=Plakobranchus ocellatus TaxID=259542 RepID=A0AAV4C6K5_9GAST|nr:potassium voltage gated channel protein shaw [Plakobranchus ocellatus]